MTATPRSRRLRTLAAALVTTAALSLTACQTGTADATGVVDSTQPPAPGTESAEKQSPATGTDSDTSGASSDSKDSSSSGSSGSSGKEATQVADRKTAKKTTSCTAKGTKVTVTDAPRPINHLLIKATNTSDTTCHLYYAPYLRFDQAQSAVPFIEESKPQAVVTLEPGESGYAGVLTSTPDGSHPYDATSLTLYYAARSGQGSTGAPSHPALPFDSVRIDSSNAVTYWQTSAADALMW
ncbi:DUF4232 domain-containing protein [Streptomyces albidoflavus]|uniref:DUF4232 domain-containing protein n=1 Tax=Streptomyces albidoflavus TaxID=1886 RepID=UPI0039FC6BA0